MNTSIQVKQETRKRLAKLGSLSETYDSVISGLLDHADQCDRFWEKKN